MFFSTINNNKGGEGTSPPKKKIFYGWVVVASFALLVAVSFGIVYSFGVFFSSFEDDFGWSRAKVSTLFSLHLFLSAVLSAAQMFRLDLQELYYKIVSAVPSD